MYSIFYYLDSIHHNIKYVIGFDFEFNKRLIALCQISFYPMKKNKYIFMYDPKLFDDDNMEIVLNTIYTSHLNRILHGSDALDIPYLYDILFKNDKMKIILFTKYLFDTRFMCEFYKKSVAILDNEGKEDNKCTIYDSLLYFDIINNDKYKELMENDDNMGPSQDRTWNIFKISSYHVKYAAYDVLYLSKFLHGLFNKAENITNLHECMTFIPVLTRFLYCDKYNITNILETSKKMNDPVNNYIIVSKTQTYKLTLIGLYNLVIKDLEIGLMAFRISIILNINYFKTGLSIMFKRIIYSIAYKYFDIYENKNNKAKLKVSMDDLYKSLNFYEMDKLMIFFDLFYNACKDKIFYIMNK